jgi:hypothetical protein
MVKWPISGGDGMSQDERRAYWESEHADHDYEGVFSISQDEGVIRPCVDAITGRGCRRVIVAGCGSNVALQQAIAERVPQLESVTGVDFPGVVEVAARRTDDPRIGYVGADIAEDGCGVSGDCVITVNSVLSDLDDENRALLRRFREALPAGGLLAGFFPTIFTPLELGYLQPDRRMLAQVNLEECRFAEEKQGVTQIFYSPLRLRAVLREAGFELQRMEVVFFDSPELADHARTYYGLGDDSDVMAWELFVEAVAQ